ncbi:MAG: bifunctional diguanylate cyclase/phosphodiesterase [Oscillospiraceae bacterium]|nr:bifunctional diguanylate cyclase/phosphodiesterase [Oscillospiraceae bacterium]
MVIAVILLSALSVVVLGALIVAVYKILSMKRAASQYVDIDEMTGLANREGFMRRGRELLEHTDLHSDGEIALIVFDVDKLRLINTLFGTDSGDKVVCAFADALRDVAGKGDVVGRVDTDDFALLTRLHGKSALLVAESFAKKLPDLIANEQMRDQVNYYAGICKFDGHDDIYTLFNKANLCLLTHSDNQRISEFTSDMENRMVENEILRSEMLEALDNGQFELYYQPKVEFRTGEMIGVEALIRWHHPVKGFVPPCDFIPLAEQFGIITKIDEWGLMTACKQGKKWHDMGLRDMKISVNMSQAQFVRTDVYATVVHVLAETGFDPHCLEIEVTETMAMTDIDHTVGVLNKIHSLGVSISMDDFGTGYSSLASLKTIPFDVLKIDRSLVCDVNDNDTSRRITSAIVAMGKALKMIVLAEGVETDEQSKLLTDLGCDLAQGYYYSKPRPAEEIEKILSDTPRSDMAI